MCRARLQRSEPSRRFGNEGVLTQRILRNRHLSFVIFANRANP
jgi:hypothetical protein